MATDAVSRIVDEVKTPRARGFCAAASSVTARRVLTAGDARAGFQQVVHPVMEGAAGRADTSLHPSPERRRGKSPRVAILIATVAALIAVALTVIVIARVLDRSDDTLTFLKPDPTRVVFDRTGPQEGLVTLRNTSAETPVVLRAPRVTGTGEVAFSVDKGTCRDALDPGRSCEMTVRFAPPRSGTFVATLVVQTDRGPAPEVELVGTAQL